ncbi:Hsp20/alpha crystallin family protein [Catenulispora subtropica]|uniref:SHSP domain-containing protein n=1 Tax=Catenulispora subtropica TaxID=450798 RepID=A0ABN2TAP6_9ACTN
MNEISRRHQIVPLPDLRDWFDPFGMLEWRPKLDFHPIRVEDRFEEDGTYVLSAEMPGIDPEHDVELVVSEGTLTILAERSSEQHDKRHSEFRYGAFSRAVRLPANAKEEEITANYRGGILTVRVPVVLPPKAAARKINVAAEHHGAAGAEGPKTDGAKAKKS